MRLYGSTVLCSKTAGRYDHSSKMIEKSCRCKGNAFVSDFRTEAYLSLSSVRSIPGNRDYIFSNSSRDPGVEDMAAPGLESQDSGAVNSQWYRALYEEDCMDVMKLLAVNPRLLNVGWKSEPSPQVKGRRVNFWMEEEESPWKGRTALHVGARRGCTMLVKQVLTLCQGRIEDTSMELEEQQRFKEEVTNFLKQQQQSLKYLQGEDRSMTHPTAVPQDQVQSETEVNETIAGSSSHSKSNEMSSEISMLMDQLTTARRHELADWEIRFRKEYGIGKDPRPSADNLIKWQEIVDIKDGEYDLDAVAMAYLNGNLDVLCLVIPFEQLVQRSCKGARVLNQEQLQLELRDGIRSCTEKVIKLIVDDPFYQEYFKSILQAYSKHRDFNFLPWKEYFFHFLFSTCFRAGKDDESVIKAEYLRDCLWTATSFHYSRAKNFAWKTLNLLSFLMKLQDGQGRTPLHIAVDERTVQYFLTLFHRQNKLSDESWQAFECAWRSHDFFGRTACHRSIAIGDWDTFVALVPLSDEIPDDHVEQGLKEIVCDREHPLGVDLIARRNGFTGRRLFSPNAFRKTPIQIALIHRQRQIANHYLDLARFGNSHDLPFSIACGNFFDPSPSTLNTLELAALVGEAEAVQFLLKWKSQNWKWEEGELKKQGQRDYSLQWPIILFAASNGNYQMLKAILDCTERTCDPLVVDSDGNTALHYAMKMGGVQFEAHLLDYVSCEHLRAKDPRKVEKNRFVGNNLESDSIIQRQRCINLLLEIGCDVFKPPNSFGQTPYPNDHLSTNTDFLLWWYGIQSNESTEVRNTLSSVASAVAVTATLIATASYVGPLQPPLGYSQGDHNQIQAQYIWVQAFIVCDTLSFYLAIASITFSLISSIPMPEQRMVQELRRTRMMVTLATGILLPSIICILMAFASSSIAVTSSGADGISSKSGTSTIVTSVIGGSFCLLGFILFFIRILRFIFPTNSFARKVYQATSL